jgi:hypothetical protein
MVLDIVSSEVARASSKYPAFNSAHEGYAVLLEEVDELWDEVKADNIDLACAEAIQVAAMAVRFIVDLHEAKLPGLMEKPGNDHTVASPCLSMRSTDVVSCTFGTPADLLPDFGGFHVRPYSPNPADHQDLYLDETFLDYCRLHHLT